MHLLMAFPVATATDRLSLRFPNRVKRFGRYDSHILWRASREAVSFENEIVAEVTRQHKLRKHPAGHMRSSETQYDLPVALAPRKERMAASETVYSSSSSSLGIVSSDIVCLAGQNEPGRRMGEAAGTSGRECEDVTQTEPCWAAFLYTCTRRAYDP